jgi:hypothetical protein
MSHSMDTLHEVIEHLLLAAAQRDGGQEPVVTVSQMVQASGRRPREIRAFLEMLVQQGALRCASYLLADCPRCRMPLSVPAPVAVGYALAAPAIGLRLTAVWCSSCQLFRLTSELRTEPAYARASTAFGAAG